MSKTKTIFDPITIGDYALKNRVFMAPMTRSRAQANGTPTEIMAEYYRQRASAGLIITEATSISPQGAGWLNTPGIYNAEQLEAWKPVTEAVRLGGGRIFLQLWHMGRASHPDFLDGELPVAPSAIRAEGESHTPKGKKPYVEPRALALDEMPGIVEMYAKAATNAIAVGFDGVEIHAANGYLLDEFIRDGSNRRTDAYGGDVAGRWRLPLEVTRACIDAIGGGRCGIRVSPTGGYNDMADSDPVATFGHGAGELEKLGLAFLHVVEGLPGTAFAAEGAPTVHPHLRARFSGPLILNGGYDRETGNAALAKGEADAIAYGVPFIANPDLPRRLRDGLELNAPKPETFYVPGVAGYIDYPSADVRV